MIYMEIVRPKVDHSKLAELGHMIKGTPPTKAASSLSLNYNDQLRASSSDSESELEFFLKRAELQTKARC
jgi:hypothetical protein